LQNKSYIVLGASSKIGSVFYSKFKKKIKFASKNLSQSNQLIKFDLNKSNIDPLISKYKPTHIIIFSAESDPDKCFKNPKKTKKINYTSTIKIIRKCIKKKIIPIVFSSEFVFDGKKGNYNEKSKSNPILVYGKQKKLLENYILKKKLPVLIFRLAKVYSDKKNDKTLITNYIDQIKKKKILKSAKDQYFSPIYINDVVNIIDKAAQKNLTGLYNLAGNQRLNRFQILKMIIKIFKSKNQIIPCSIDDFNLPEKRPKDVSMSNSLLKKKLKYKFSNIKSIIKKIRLKEKGNLYAKKN
jgi:dTDP-4-dehydrorhamnose reductase